MTVRIIAGSLGGRRIATPPDARPTTDRVREAVFSSLADDVTDAAVLDLYAGSGAYAIEALSRGAARAMLVERDRGAADVCEENLELLRLTDDARVDRRAVDAVVRTPPPREAPFDLVFLDPPYDTPNADVEAAIDRLTEPGWLVDDAVVVVERPARGEAVVTPGFETRWTRRYGDTLVTVLDRSVE